MFFLAKISGFSGWLLEFSLSLLAAPGAVGCIAQMYLYSLDVFRYIGTMDVDLTLESEKFSRSSVVRAFFLRDNKESNVYNETLTMNHQSDPQLKCTDVTAYLIVSTDIGYKNSA